LTCKIFTKNHVLCGSLFHDIRLYTTLDSVDNLTALAKHSYLYKYVQRIEFMHPKLEEQFCHGPTYMKELTRIYKGRLRSSPTPEIDFSREESWPSGQESQDSEEVIKNNIYPWPSRDIWAGLQAYRAAFAEQEFVLTTLYPHMVGKIYLTRFPKFSSVRISQIEDPYCFRSHIFPTWLSTHHPEILIREGNISYLDHSAENQFVYTVLKTLNTAKIRPKELSFSYNHGVRPDMDWSGSSWSSPAIRPGNDTWVISDLKILNLNFRRTAYDEYRLSLDWNPLIKPIQIACKQLEALYIHVDRFPMPDGDTSMDEILEMARFPLLRDFHLDSWKITGVTFANFLNAHPLLEELSHGTHKTSEALADHKWGLYWRAIHIHPRLSRLALAHCLPNSVRQEVIRIETELGFAEMNEQHVELEYDVLQALYDYAHKQGEWTDELTAMWGCSV
jgi:hypothetical protein